MKTTLRIAYTATIVMLIILPLPPSTIIGVMLATNKRTGKYMDQRVYRVVRVGMGYVGNTVMVPIRRVSKGREISARMRITSKNYLL